MAVIRELFSDGGARDRDDAIREISQALGHGRVGSNIRDALDDDLRTAVRRGILQNDRNGLSLFCRNIGEYERDHLVTMLIAAMGTGWWDRPDAIRATARHLGYRRTGSEIRAAMKSAINGAIRRGLVEADGQCIRKA